MKIKPKSSVIFYPAYREFLDERTRVNDGVMALLAGSKLSAHLLQLTRGSQRTLLEMFPNVPHVKNFNLVSDLALSELENSEYHLASMAIPYLLATYESFVAQTCQFLFENSSIFETIKSNWGIKELHDYLERNFSVSLRTESSRILTLLTQLRNDIIHAGGKARRDYGYKYIDDIANELGHWKLLPGGAIPTMKKGDKIIFSYTELILTLAVVKDLARQINVAIQTAIDPTNWAKVIYLEFSSESNFASMNKGQRLKALLGYSRTRYAALSISPELYLSLV